MKNLALIFFAIAALAFSCKEGTGSSGLTIDGTFTNASNLQVYFDKVGLNPESPNLVIVKADADASGKFSLNVPEKPTAGIYRLRVGEQQIFLVLDGKEKGLKVNGDLSSLNQFQYEIEGCESCIAYRDIMQKIVAKQAQPADAQAFIENTPNAMAGVLVALQAFGGNPTYLDTYKKAKTRLEAAYPGSDYVRDYDLFLTSIQKVQQPSNGGFQFYEESQRQAAPDIKLNNPDGQEYSLSDLKGKVVLLDFWASWCRPCRMENPNVVNVYKNYKDKGFTVFSVSLDGIDSRMEQSFAGDTKGTKRPVKTK